MKHHRNPTTAAWLALTLGGFGAHALYMGRPVSAALRLAFCWTGLPFLLGLWDFSRLIRAGEPTSPQVTIKVGGLGNVPRVETR